MPTPTDREREIARKLLPHLRGLSTDDNAEVVAQALAAYGAERAEIASEDLSGLRTARREALHEVLVEIDQMCGCEMERGTMINANLLRDWIEAQLKEMEP